MSMLTLETFAPHVGPDFRIRLDPQRVVDVELVEVTPLGGRDGGVVREASGRQPFALYFKAPTQIVLPQGTYRIEHAAVGDHEIFIVAIGPGRGGMLYEAIFT